jgi:poly-beta-1,6-N-acetyl-D-glucosamine synthase
MIQYVLITPARNEAEFIGQTIEAVIAQKQKPLRWVIVSDGSTDGTDEIVKRYQAENPWIELVRMPERTERHFAGKVNAFNAGFARVKDLDFEVIGNLDADITFDPEYLAFLMGKFEANPQLGVGGTPFREGNHQYDYRFTSIEHVSGACQLFRRKCFEAIGGYTARKIGGVDLVAVISARMRGWQTRSFTEKTCQHHRTMAKSRRGPLRSAFYGGHCDYMLGSHLLWQSCRSVYQLTRKPFIVGGCMRLAGFVWGMVSRSEISVTEEFVRFRRKEQMQRLRKFLVRA